MCPACGEPYNLRGPSFILAVKVGSGHQDVMFLKADCPAYKELAVIALFKLYTNTGGKGFNGNEASSSTGKFGSGCGDMIEASEYATWLMLRNIPRKALSNFRSQAIPCALH
eukprot:1832273-Karenia_brevis.AAC.1